MESTYRSILVDGDRLASQFSAQAEGEIRSQKAHNVHALEEKTVMELTQKLNEWEKRFEVQSLEIAFSDSAHFRRLLYSGYKAYSEIVIKDSRLYHALIKYLKLNFPYLMYPGLESIDVLGVWATSPYPTNEPRLMISTNPDLMMIPGDRYDPRTGESTPVPNSRFQADLEFFRQVLCGRPADNFEGCPGMDSPKALEMLEPFREAVAEYQNQYSGWKNNIWQMIVKTYQSSGKTREDALFCAQLARVCRYTDYDWVKKKPILWSP